ncbi:MAG: OmpH family outer membrane protein [Gammaproteobacteria bacterium]|nr:MAG: OmpH family outer membrane protein [Gammaproteobacteria bacterium]
MKKIAFIIKFALIFCMFAGTAVADGAKIGWVSRSRILAEAPQVNDAKRKLEEEFSPREQELMQRGQDIRDQEEQLQRDAAVMKAETARNLEREIISNKRELKRLTEELREDFSIRQNEVLNKLQSYTAKVIVDYSKKNKYDLVLSDGVVYAGPNADITDAILQILKKDFEAAKKAKK